MQKPQKTAEKGSKNGVLLIDLDGTIADPFDAIGSSLRYAFEQLSLGNLTDDQIRRLIGPPFYQSFPEEFGFSKEQTLEVIESYRKNNAEEGLAMYRPYPNMERAIAGLNENFKLYLATSKPQVYADRILRTFNLHHLFTGVYGPDLDGSRSNKTDLLQHLLFEEDLDPERCVMIGDRKHDMIAGKNVGVKTLGVLWGYGSREELESHAADHVIEKIEELQHAAEKLTKI